MKVLVASHYRRRNSLVDFLKSEGFECSEEDIVLDVSEAVQRIDSGNYGAMIVEELARPPMKYPIPLEFKTKLGIYDGGMCVINKARSRGVKTVALSPMGYHAYVLRSGANAVLDFPQRPNKVIESLKKVLSEKA